MNMMKVSSRNMTRVIAAFDALHAGCACGLTADGIERCKMHRAILRSMDGNPEACIFSCVKLCEKPVGNSSRSLTHCRIGCLVSSACSHLDPGIIYLLG